MLAPLLLGIGAVLMPVNCPAAAVADACSKELLLAYFPENFVSETLKKFNVPQDQWAAITKELAAKDKDVVKDVEEKAAKMTPNPLKDRSPEQRQAAVKIFREALFNIFSSVLKAHGVTDEKQIQAMLTDIQQQKAKNFAQCMEKQKTQFEKDKSGQQQPASQPVPKEEPNKDLYLSENDNSAIKNNDQPAAETNDDADEDFDDDEDEDNDDEGDQKSQSSDKQKGLLSDAQESSEDNEPLDDEDEGKY